MGISGGPNILGKDNLSFMYDLADNNSYKGKPGTNIATLIDNFGTYNDTYFKTNYGTEIDNIPGLGGNTLVRYINIFNDYPNSGVCCPSIFGYGSGISLSGSTAYTYQLIYKTTIAEGANYLYRYEYNGGTYITEVGLWNSTNTEDLGNGWKHAWGQFTTNASTNLGYFSLFFYNYSAWHNVKVAGICITQGSTILRPRQFIPNLSTRSATQGLLDLTSNRKSIDISNVSYSSNADITFDGTDDQISVGNLGSGFDTFTVEIWFKSDSVVNYRNPIDCNWLVFNGGASGYSNIGPRLEQNNSGNLTWVVGDAAGNYSFVNLVTSGLSATPVHHAVITRTSSTSFSGYYNGDFTSNLTFSGWIGAMSNVNIGRGFSTSSERWFIGKVFSVKIYNRALSASEVKQNYNSQKSRFGL